MAPSFVSLGAAAALAYSAGVAAADSYQLADSYDYTNFFDKFNFFTSKYGTGDYNDVDPTSGFVNYRSREDAEHLGLITTQGTEVFIGVNHANTYDAIKGPGRDSVRIESKELYTHGLFISEFTHLPKPACGLWPAFWMFGDPWPTVGEFDIYEGWNLAAANTMTLHADHAETVGSCELSGTGQTGIASPLNCDNYAQHPVEPIQYLGQGCGSTDTKGPWGNSNGAVFAMEWSSKNISVWSFDRDHVPYDIQQGKPNPRSWGLPTFYLSHATCDLDAVLSKQKLVLNIDFCGVTAGNPDVWKYGGCQALTGAETCNGWVAGNPDEFNDAFWKIKNIDIYKYGTPPAEPTTTTTSTTSEYPTTTEATSTEYPTTSDEPTTYPGDSTSTEEPTGFPTITYPGDTTSSEMPTEFPTITYPGDTTSSEMPTEFPTITYPGDTTSSEMPTEFPTITYPGDTTSSELPTEFPTITYPGDTTSSELPTEFPTITYPGDTTSSEMPTEFPTITYPGDTTSSEEPTEFPTISYPTSWEYPETSTSTQYVTSTSYSTKCHTITSAGVTYVTTETLGTYTTVCPEETSTEAPVIVYPTVFPYPTSYPEGYTTSTIHVTTTYTVTKCPSYVTNCPVGDVTSSVYETVTICPIAGPTTTTTLATTLYLTKTVAKAKPTAPVYETYTATVVPQPSYNASAPATYPPVGTGAPVVPCYGEGCQAKYPVVTAGAAKVGASVVVVVGAALVMLL